MGAAPTPTEFRAAVAALRRGDVIGLPTETVYGLAADAGNVEAVRRIFALKGRPADHPLIVHIADASDLATWTSGASPLAARLAEAFWPGPLTLILPRSARVPDVVTGGQDTVGLRCPDHPVALAVLREFGGGLAAPSANRFGRISPTSAAHVREEFPSGVNIVLDGGDCEIGIESTILDLSSGEPRILRPGRISAARIEAVIGPVAQDRSEHSPRASGTLEAHYAPRTPLLMMPRRALEKEAREQGALGKRVAILGVGTVPRGSNGLALPEDAESYAHGLYAALRQLDSGGQQLLLVERPPDDPAWDAVQDRLRRAAAGAAADDDSP
jgi:L-threonylcarbamoyladenylate synthase